MRDVWDVIFGSNTDINSFSLAGARDCHGVLLSVQTGTAILADWAQISILNWE